MYEFPKTNRLLKRSEFRESLDNGVKVVDSHLVMLGKKTEHEPKVGIIVSKKVGNAVVRNRIKRRLRERFRAVKNENSGVEFVIIARARAAEAETDEIFRAFDRCIGKLRRRIEA